MLAETWPFHRDHVTLHDVSAAELQVTAPAGRAFVQIPSHGKCKLPAVSPTVAANAAEAVIEKPVCTLLDYAAWVVSSADGATPCAPLRQELCSVGDAARRLQVCCMARQVLHWNAHHCIR